MRQFKLLGIVCVQFALMQPTKKQADQQTSPPAGVASADTVATPHDSLTVDLLALKDSGAFQKTVAVRVAADPVFMATQNFRGVPLRAFLEKYTSVENMDVAQSQLTDAAIGQILKYLTYMKNHKKG